MSGDPDEQPWQELEESIHQAQRAYRKKVDEAAEECRERVRKGWQELEEKVGSRET